MSNVKSGRKDHKIPKFSMSKAATAVNNSMRIEGYKKSKNRQLTQEAKRFAFGK